MYYYNQQLKKYLVQFMAIFNDMLVQTGTKSDGSPDFTTVPVKYGSKDRVSVAILNQNVQNTVLRLPVMSAYLRTLNLYPERRKAINNERRTPYVPLGGLVPDDIKVIHQLQPIPYLTNVELSIYTSNQDTHFQILEQIFLLFDPDVQIQTTDATFDYSKITTVELKNINFEEAYPSGTTRRMIVSTLTFAMPIYLSAPVKVRKDAIQEIFIRVGAVNGDLTSDNVFTEFDAQGLDYTKLVDADQRLDDAGIE